MKHALIVGCQGQDGRLLWDFLAARGYGLTGLSRRGEHAGGADQPGLATGPAVDVADAGAVSGLVDRLRPDEIYYLAAHHHSSQDRHACDPHTLWTRSLAVNAAGPAHVLEAIRSRSPKTRFFYAGSCLVYGHAGQAGQADEAGQAGESPQTEETCFRPSCVYGISKTAGMHAVRHYRESHGVFAVGGILYNHESHLRAERFLSRKIVRGAWRIRRGEARELVLGDLSARADWGYAPDFVDAFWRTLQTPEPADYVVATGKLSSVRDWVEKTFELAGLNWQEHVREDASLLGSRRVPLVGDISRLATATGWRPHTGFEAMVEHMFEREGHTS